VSSHTVVEPDEVDASLKYAEIFGSVLSGMVDLLMAGGAVGNSQVLPQLRPPADPNNPPPPIASLFKSCLRGHRSTASSEKRDGKSWGFAIASRLLPVYTSVERKHNGFAFDDHTT
jgi:hypothetical protein